MNRPTPKRWFFDLWSRVYDAAWVQRITYYPVHDPVLDALRDARPARLLDLGCGTGQLTSRLAARFPPARVVGCDFSAGMLDRAGSRGRAIDLVQSDAGDLPFAAGSFDVVVSTEAFHWFPDQGAALAECFRVLRPGGRLLIATVNTPAAALSSVIYLGSRLAGEPFYWPSRSEARRWVEAAGFRIERRQRVLRFGGPLLPAVLTCAVRPPVAALRSARAPTSRRQHTRAAGRGEGAATRPKQRPVHDSRLTPVRIRAARARRR